MIFRKSGCLVVTSNLVKLKSISSWPKNTAKTTENDFCFHFHFKWLLALENRRERERERERARRSPTSEQEDRIGARRLHSSDRSNPPSLNPVTDHRDRFTISGPRVKRETERERRETITPVRLQRRSILPPSHDLAFASVARSRLLLHRSNPIASLSSFFSQFDWIWWIFLLGFVSFVSECGIDSFSTCLQLRKCMKNWVAWLCKAFSVKMFERTKHRNWFSVKRIPRQPNNLKNFPFLKIEFPKNIYFSENILWEPNTA